VRFALFFITFAGNCFMNSKISKLAAMKSREKIAMLTAYDANTTKLIDSCGIDLILVGDSVANVLLGYENTTKISMQEMLHHVAAVCRAKPNASVVADMPIHSYDNPKIALENAKKFLSVGADAVKVEGPKIDVVKELVKNKIPVQGHIGLLPQTMLDYKVQGKTDEIANKIIADAVALDKAGIFSLVIECVPAALGKKITESVSVPTIGIGAGADCDGQVLVINDLVGMNSGDFRPKFVKQYANLKNDFLNAVNNYKKEVKERKFPSEEFSYK
jgi:3-methyl-2-oxobutanoate hydroxymethyltransferase